MKNDVEKPSDINFLRGVELRRWCVEKAIGWPTVACPKDEDVIARAEKLYEWVTK